MDVNELKKWLSSLTSSREEKKGADSKRGPLPDQLFEESDTLAEKLGIAKADLPLQIKLPKEFYKKLSYAFVKRNALLPLEKRGELLIVAISDPLSVEPLEELRMMLGTALTTLYAPKSAIDAAIHDCYGKETGEASLLIAELDEKQEGKESEIESYDLLDDSSGGSPIIKLLNLILTEAIQQTASDIHFEPLEDSLRVRYRVDGVLHTKHLPAQEYQGQLLTRIKVMAKLDIAERRLPQDGRIKLRMGKREIDFRVSTIPVVGGERIVLRILDKGSVSFGLSELKMPKMLQREFEKLIDLPEGIILVTGPTGSGKTTTLYSALTDISNDSINIMTIEDPVEYYLKGIAQIGVKPKIHLTFAAGLRHILRQDPDVVMVGEIRDVETAEIAIQASLTGHLVLSTLHTNDAPSAITRLVDMGIEPYLISSSLVAVLAQRLVRCICPHCKTAYRATGEELRSLGIEGVETLYKGAGCSRCFGSGYLGRRGVYELLKITPMLQQQIVKSPDAAELRRHALEEGLQPLRVHGAELVKQGETSVSEVLRVIRGIEED